MKNNKLNLFVCALTLMLFVRTPARAEEICNTIAHGRPSTEEMTALANEVGLSAAKINLIRHELGKVVMGQDHVVDTLLIGILSNGHILLEGLPGLAKTLVIKSLSETVGGAYNRVQFTPDLLPSDITGSTIYNPKEQDFVVKKGPVFANFFLADEINRAPSKVQAALLQAMEERIVTLNGQTFRMSNPFLVLATQNPVDQAGTYLLPEAQLDRFMMKVNVQYPSVEDEIKVVYSKAMGIAPPTLERVVTLEDLAAAKEIVSKIYIAPSIVRSIVEIVDATRFPAKYGLADIAPLIQIGASPRASISLTLAVRAHAFLQGRAEVNADDIRAIAKDVLKHRIALSFKGEAQKINKGEIVDQIVERVLEAKK